MAKIQQMDAAQQAALQNQNALAANYQARQIVLNESYPVIQEVESQTFDPKNKSTFDVTPANIGIVKGFTIVVKAIIDASEFAQADAAQLCNFGAANLIQRITYYDPDNQRHTETTGWHLHLINSLKQGRPYLAPTQYNGFGAPSGLEYPVFYGNKFKVQSARPVISGEDGGLDQIEVTFTYYLPLAYSDTDLTGAVLANVPQSKQRLKIEFANNNTAFNNTTVDKLTTVNNDAIYNVVSQTGKQMKFTEMSYTVYQHYLDQLPVGQNGYILPLIDLSTLYCLENSAFGGITPNVDFTVQYANLYKYLSTVAIYDKGSIEDHLNGENLNYLSQRTANFSDTCKMSPVAWVGQTRKMFGNDLPFGVYYKDNRDKPVYTLQYGNVGFVVNPKKVAPDQRLLMGYEYFTSRTELINAGTIATN